MNDSGRLAFARYLNVELQIISRDKLLCIHYLNTNCIINTSLCPGDSVTEDDGSFSDDMEYTKWHVIFL